MTSPQFQELLRALRNAPDRSGMSIDDLRTMQRQQAEQRPIAPDITCQPCTLNGVAAEWVGAPGASPDWVLLYFHGGGYYRGAIDTVREMVSRMSRASGARALPIDYRLAPEDPFPAAVDDTLTSYRWLLDNGYKPNNIVIGGDSAGGGLTVALLVNAREHGLPLPAGGVCLSPWVDLTQSGDSYTAKASEDPSITRAYLDKYADLYLPGADPKNPLASPLFADLSGLPPLLIQVGTAEVLLDDAVQLAARARAAGVKVELDAWEQMTHVWQNNGPGLPESQEAIARIGVFIKQCLG
jgi:monoterpene epsilon-lactone hydrolase